MITPLDIEAIRKRAEAATPGPWETSSGVSVYAENGSVINIAKCALAEEGYGWSGSDYSTMGYVLANAEFIAHARTDIPALLSHIAALEAERWEMMALIAILAKKLANETGEVRISNLDVEDFEPVTVTRWRDHSTMDHVIKLEEKK